MLDLYIALSFGHPTVGRAVHFAFAKARGFFSRAVRDQEILATYGNSCDLQTYLDQLYDRHSKENERRIAYRESTRRAMIECVSDDINTECSGFLFWTATLP